MKKVLLIISVFITVIAHSQTYYNNCQDGKIFLKIQDDQTPFLPEQSGKIEIEKVGFLNELLSNYDIISLEKAFNLACASPQLNRIYLLTFTNYSDVDYIIRDLESMHEIIDYAERVPFDRISYVPNDPLYSLTEWGYNWNWHLDKIQAEQAWNITTGSSTIRVAIVDNAIWSNHPDLTNKIVAQYDGNTQTAGNSNPPTSVSQTASMTSYEWSHGTHCSGLVGAESDNNTGIASIGFDVSLMTARSADNNGDMYYTGYGVQWAANNGADVISMSYGSSQYSASYDQFFSDLKTNGIVLVAAAGNDGVSTNHYPAAYSAVIAVGSSDENDHLSSFSQYGSWVDIAAPGGYSPDGSATYKIDLLSTTYCEAYMAGSVPSLTNQNYDIMHGTSMACPVTAGVCGLMLSLNPNLTPDEVLSCLQTTADPLQGGNSISSSGGRINAFSALQCVQSSLNVPPIADFSASTTTVTVGNTVTFTDACIGTVNNYNWSFPGGTPNTATGAGPHIIQYDTPGQYDVTLTATNTYGSDTETKTSYITVVDAGTGCDLLYNYGSTDSLTLYGFSSYWGSWSGHNELPFEQFAEHITNNIYNYVHGMYVAVGRAYAGSPSDVVTFRIWDNSGGNPNTVLATKDYQINTLNEYSWNYIEFDNPVAVGTDFFAGYEVYYNSPADTFNVFINEARTAYNTAFVYYSSAWGEMGTYGLPTSFGIEVLACSDDLISYYGEDTTQACTGNPIEFTDGSLGNVTSWNWDFGAGATPPSANTVGPHTVTYSTPGQKTITLTVGNGTGTDVYTNYVDIFEANAAITPASPTVCSGETVILEATGGTSYVWNNGPATSTNVVNPTSNTTYTVTVSSGNCTDVVSVTVNVTPAPVGGTSSPASPNICENTSTTVSVSGYSGNIQWQQSPDGMTGWADVTGGSGATTATYNTPNLSVNTYYRAKLSLATCSDVFSNVSMVQVDPPPVSGTATISLTTVCSGNTVDLTLAGYTGVIQWQSSPDGSSWSDISGATTDTYTTTGLLSDTYFQAVVSATGCADATSNQVQVTVTPGPVAGTVSASATSICAGSTVDLTLTGYTGNIQWQESLDGGTTWSDISGATNSTYTTNPISAGIMYQAVLSSGACPDVTTGPMVISLIPDPVANFTYTENNLSVDFTDASTNATSYMWDFGDGNTSTMPSPSHTYASSGSYTVTLITTNTCGIPDTSTQLIDVITSINAINTAEVYEIYPNPNNGLFNVRFSNISDPAVKIEVFTITGQLVDTREITKTTKGLEYQFDLSHLAKGTYQLRISSQEHSFEDTIIIE